MEKEELIDYNECSREKLLELLAKRDAMCVELGNKYLALNEHVNKTLQYIIDESFKANKMFKTEETLNDAGVPSADQDLVYAKEIAKLEAYQKIVALLTPIFNH